MKNTFGNNITVTLFGESHGEAIGAVLDGIAPGIKIDRDYILNRLSLRRPSGNISTLRQEPDNFVIESGVFNGYTTGTPLCIIIPNENTISGDYSDLEGKARPGHADYTGHIKYKGFEDYRGGGHFSGRITAALVAVCAIISYALEQKGIYIGTHMLKCAGIKDRDFFNIEKEIKELSVKDFAVLDKNVEQKMIEAILSAKSDGDSVGGILETAVYGIPAGVGEPWFDSVESIISHGILSIPAVKGIEFGDGFSMADMQGSNANDSFCCREGKITSLTNHNGGINGGITNGMPIIFRSAVKPTPTISKTQKTVDFRNNQNVLMEAKGRHDPCIVHRARIVVDSVTALCIADLLSIKYGTDWLAE